MHDPVAAGGGGGGGAARREEREERPYNVFASCDKDEYQPPLAACFIPGSGVKTEEWDPRFGKKRWIDKRVAGYFAERATAEKNSTEMNTENRRRNKISEKMPERIAMLLMTEPERCKNLMGIPPEDIWEFLHSKQGLQSAHMNVLLTDDAMLWRWFEHLNEWLESHPLTPELLEKQQAYLADKAAILEAESLRASELAELQARADLAEGMARTAAGMLSNMANAAFGYTPA
jgi:hypothetical protein